MAALEQPTVSVLSPTFSVKVVPVAGDVVALVVGVTVVAGVGCVVSTAVSGTAGVVAAVVADVVAGAVVCTGAVVLGAVVRTGAVAFVV